MFALKPIVLCCRKLSNRGIFCKYIYSDKLVNLKVSRNCLIFPLHSCALEECISANLLFGCDMTLLFTQVVRDVG